MWRLTQCLTLLGALVLAAGPTLAQGRRDYIQDDAGLFSREAKTQAMAEMARIHNRFKKELVVDTVGAVKLPEEKMAKDDVDRFIDGWASKRFDNGKVNGVYVVIVENPGKMRVRVGNNTQKLGFFTVEDRRDLEKLILDKLKNGRKDAKVRDQALTGAAQLVYQRMEQNKGTTTAHEPTRVANPKPVVQQPREEVPWGRYLLIALGVIAGIWLLSALFRGFSGGGGGGGPGGGGGGGFMSNFLGGLVGAAAGMWLYNSFFGGHQSAAYGGETHGGVGGGADASGGADTGSTGGGGDWGDSGSSGGDAGGDVGGGDWGGGGGDWGGGGGDFGGGGGDW